jgi:hypothetical protein
MNAKKRVDVYIFGDCICGDMAIVYLIVLKRNTIRESGRYSTKLNF